MMCLTCVRSVLGFVFLGLLSSFWFLTTWWVRPMSSRSSCFWRNKWSNHEEMRKQKREITDWCYFLALRVSWFANERDNQVVKSTALEMAKTWSPRSGDSWGTDVSPCRPVWKLVHAWEEEGEEGEEDTLRLGTKAAGILKDSFQELSILLSKQAWWVERLCLLSSRSLSSLRKYPIPVVEEEEEDLEACCLHLRRMWHPLVRVWNSASSLTTAANLFLSLSLSLVFRFICNSELRS
jgi:hypothetical protein